MINNYIAIYSTLNISYEHINLFPFVLPERNDSVIFRNNVSSALVQSVGTTVMVWDALF